MSKSAGRILKAKDVELEGQLTLSIVQQPESKQSGSALSEPQVRIVESQPDFAVIEITCSCGTGMNIKCEYTGTKTPDAKEDSQTQVKDNEPESPDSKEEQTQ